MKAAVNSAQTPPLQILESKFKKHRQRPLVLVRASWRTADAFRIACNTERETLHSVHSQFLFNAERVINTMLGFCSLAHSGRLVKIKKLGNGETIAVPLRVDDIAKQSGITKRTVERVLAVCERFGWLQKTGQRKRVSAEALVVEAVHRRFTDKFWRALRLINDFCSACAAAAKKTKITLQKAWYRFAHGKPTQNKLNSLINGLAAKVAVPTYAELEMRRQELRRQADELIKSATFS